MIKQNEDFKIINISYNSLLVLRLQFPKKWSNCGPTSVWTSTPLIIDVSFVAACPWGIWDPKLLLKCLDNLFFIFYLRKMNLKWVIWVFMSHVSLLYVINLGSTFYLFNTYQTSSFFVKICFQLLIIKKKCINTKY